MRPDCSQIYSHLAMDLHRLNQDLDMHLNFADDEDKLIIGVDFGTTVSFFSSLVGFRINLRFSHFSTAESPISSAEIRTKPDPFRSRNGPEQEAKNGPKSLQLFSTRIRTKSHSNGATSWTSLTWTR